MIFELHDRYYKNGVINFQLLPGAKWETISARDFFIWMENTGRIGAVNPDINLLTVDEDTPIHETFRDWFDNPRWRRKKVENGNFEPGNLDWLILHYFNEQK